MFFTLVLLVMTAAAGLAAYRGRGVADSRDPRYTLARRPLAGPDREVRPALRHAR